MPLDELQSHRLELIAAAAIAKATTIQTSRSGGAVEQEYSGSPGSSSESKAAVRGLLQNPGLSLGLHEACYWERAKPVEKLHSYIKTSLYVHLRGKNNRLRITGGRRKTRRKVSQPKRAFLRSSRAPGPDSRAHSAHPAASPSRTCDIPELQPHQGLAVPVDDFEREIHADGGPVVLGEELVHVALDNAGFAHAQLPDHQHFEEVLPALRHAAARSFPAGHPCRGVRRRGRAAGAAALPLLNFPSQQLRSNFPQPAPRRAGPCRAGESEAGRRVGGSGEPQPPPDCSHRTRKLRGLIAARGRAAGGAGGRDRPGLALRDTGREVGTGTGRGRRDIPRSCWGRQGGHGGR